MEDVGRSDERIVERLRPICRQPKQGHRGVRTDTEFWFAAQRCRRLEASPGDWRTVQIAGQRAMLLRVGSVEWTGGGVQALAKYSGCVRKLRGKCTAALRTVSVPAGDAGNRGGGRANPRLLRQEAPDQSHFSAARVANVPLA